MERLHKKLYLHRPVNYVESAVNTAIRNGAVATLKPDGMRCIVYKLNNEVHAISREGFKIQAVYPWLNPFLTVLPDGWALDTELVLAPQGMFTTQRKRLIPQETAGGLLRNTTDPQVLTNNKVHPIFLAFDVFTTDWLFKGQDSHPANYGERLQLLQSFHYRIADRLVVLGHNPVRSPEELESLRELAIAQGEEGLIIRSIGGLLRNGKVTGAWKVKESLAEEDAPDGTITGFVDGNNSNAGKLVGFQVKLESGETVRATGLTQELIRKVTSDPDSYLGRVVTVKGMSRTATGKVRHPKFGGFRDSETAKGIKQ